ncbi:MAG: ATP synthase subunit I [Oscillospiraceae bacterium]|nr:ATP synthase subunit I [Oscillospiraceae bacterium]
MKFQTASLKEIKRISVGSGLCFVLMIAGFALLDLLGIGTLDYRVLLGGVVGTAVAVLNFAALCLTIQNAATADDKKQMKARFQLSYNIRLIAQAAWVVLAFLLECFHGIAAALPLLFPTLVIFFLQSRGVLVTPSQRKNPPQEEIQE